jgi:hypothetical protein
VIEYGISIDCILNSLKQPFEVKTLPSAANEQTDGWIKIMLDSGFRIVN